MPSAIVLSIDRLGASWLGPYGNTWLDTPHFNRLAADSLLFETALAEAPDLAQACRSWWSGRHAMQPDREGGAALPALASAAGARTVLVTDDPAVAEHPLAAGFSELQLVPQTAAVASVGEIEATSLFQLMSMATATLDEVRTPSLIWIHARGMDGAWDAPPALRQQFADEDDPEPPQFTQPPSERLPVGFDPDLLLGYVQAYAGQVAVADYCLGLLLAALDAHPLGHESLVALTSPRGYPLGEHRRVGPCDDALYGELLQIPLIVRFPGKAGALSRAQQIVQPHELYGLIGETCGWVAGESGQTSMLLAELRGDLPAPRRMACALGNGQRAIRTPAWFLRESIAEGAISRELFAKPDDRYEVNEISSRCSDEVSLLAAELDRFESAARQDELAHFSPLAAELCELWR